MGTLREAGAALLSALLFGITTPLAKQLLVGAHPLLIAGLLYAGSGLGLTLLILVQDRGHLSLGLARSDWPWLAASVVSGGVVAPALLMFGLARADAAAASLLLNIEAVFTAVMAWILFREATSRRVVLGFVAIFAGSVVLVWPSSLGGNQSPLALASITSACLFWAVDNNLTRKISAGGARAIAAVKRLAAGVTNVGLALGLQAGLPSVAKAGSTLLLGFLGNGMSLVLFIFSLRNLGTARTGAYFATAPFIGSAMAILLYGRTVGWTFWVAALCMTLGVWLHLTESHQHEHTHEPLVHSHAHSHDAHHQHEHAAHGMAMSPTFMSTGMSLYFIAIPIFRTSTTSTHIAEPERQRFVHAIREGRNDSATGKGICQLITADLAAACALFNISSNAARSNSLPARNTPEILVVL